jgi:DNA-binding response OmpR family regulator
MTTHANDTANAPMHCETSPAGAIVILCAEEDARDVIAYWLGTSGPVVVAEDGYHAARLLDDGGRWLVTDRVLPPWPGLGTFLELHGRYPRLRIAFIENGSREERILARVTGANVLLAKPLTRRALSAALLQPDAAP